MRRRWRCEGVTMMGLNGSSREVLVLVSVPLGAGRVILLG